MKVQSKLAGALAVTALVLVSASPASARGYDGRWGRYSQHHRGHDNSGAVIGAILGVGIIAAIASSAARQREAERGYPQSRPGDRNYDPGYQGQGYDNRSYDDRDYGRDYGRNDGYEGGAANASTDEDVAVDACAIAARDQASRFGGFAEVRDITGTNPYGNGWDVTGTVSERAGFRSNDSRLRSFRCIWNAGQVEGVTFG